MIPPFLVCVLFQRRLLLLLFHVHNSFDIALVRVWLS